MNNAGEVQENNQDPLNNIDPINDIQNINIEPNNNINNQNNIIEQNNNNNNINQNIQPNNIENINNNNINQNNNINPNNIEKQNINLIQYYIIAKNITKQILFIIIMISISVGFFRIYYSRYMDKSIVLLEESSNKTVSYKKQQNSIVFKDSFTEISLLYNNHHQYENFQDTVITSVTYAVKCKELSNISSSLNVLNYKFNGSSPFLKSMGLINDNCENHWELFKEVVKKLYAFNDLINAGIKNLIITKMDENRIHYICKQLVETHKSIQDLKVKVFINYNEFKKISRVLSAEIRHHEEGTDPLESKTDIESIARIKYQNQTSFCLSTTQRIGNAREMLYSYNWFAFEIDKMQQNVNSNINQQKVEQENAKTYEERWLKFLHRAPKETVDEIKKLINDLENQTINIEELREKVYGLIKQTQEYIEELNNQLLECEPGGKIHKEIEEYEALNKNNSIPNTVTSDDVLKQKSMTYREYSILKTHLGDIKKHLSLLNNNNPTEDLIQNYDQHFGTSINTLHNYSITTYFQSIFGMYNEIIAKILTDLKQEMNLLLFLINENKI
ncbi:TMF1-like protein [Tieghemostelium lacteum]|uniref:TMF1-like protein n=1 Tax=Tieghemostelium lacteum TaxID=361077 RepID=A0A152AA81_TIELA|nr:TMF1-like protein [Tieghemostelium lacteum]|eukprot:KYR03128.1 TMF1-like protein [Tieghemostelium lacteum]